LEPLVFAAVLGAALLHAGWNAIVKLGLDPFRSMVLLVLCAGVLAAPILPLVGLPAWQAWPYVAASAALHLGYNLVLIEAYRSGGLGVVYPIARGGAPLLVAIGSAAFLGEVLSTQAYLGIALLTFGLGLVSIRRASDVIAADRRAVAFAGVTAAFIAAYSLVDATGARVSGNASGYALVLFVLDAFITLGVAVARIGTAGLLSLGAHLKRGFAGGAMQLGGYWTVIWAMSLAPVALVSALRETSVLFAVLLAVVWLKEPMTRRRVIGAGLVVVGAIVMKLAW
jgi:drug/metabolite transporter (DMT)-like permease